LLYARDELLNQVADLTGLALWEDRRLGSPRDQPIVVVVGGRGMGKTAALSEIADAYGNRTPRAFLDLASSRYAPHVSPGHAGADEWDTPLIRILRALDWELGLKTRLGGRLRFPRLSFAMLAIAIWQPDEKITRDQATQILEREFQKIGDRHSGKVQDGRQKRQALAREMASDVVADLAAKVMPFPVNVFVTVSVKALAERTLSRPERSVALEWHQNWDPGAPGDGYEALVTLAKNFHLGGELREEAEQSLIAAFLADVSTGYRGLAGARKAGHPMVLLDNADRNEAGVRFLNLVLQQRVRARTDSLVIVAAGSRSLRGRLGLSDQDAGPGNRNRPLPAAWPDRLLAWSQLTNLGYRDALAMLDGVDQRRRPPNLAHLIWRLTGGLPLAVDEITRAVACQIPASSPSGNSAERMPPVAAADILSLPVRGKGDAPDEPVAAYVLRRLIPEDGLRDNLVTFAAAADLKAAQTLAFDQAERAREFLRDNGWSDTPRHFVGNYLLRTLLLHRLAQRAAPCGWPEVHASLRDYYGAAGTDPRLESLEPARLYHCLALGDHAQVVDHLWRAFGGDAGEWLDAVRQIACAPYRPGPGEPDRRAVALGARDSEITGDEIRRSIHRLIHAAWLLTDPFTDPGDKDVVDQLAGELAFLARNHQSGSRILLAASRVWPAGLRAWDQQQCDRPMRRE
jgi:hypothetical protein